LADDFDLIVIGAGINGAGVARDAAMRGLKVCVLDKADIASGTSSASTRLIHGGLRYLEYGEFGLVRESLRERETLLKIAPHLVRPIPILIPVYQHARRGRFQLRAGMVLYDALSYDKSLPRHQMLSRNETLQRAPALNSDGLTGGAIYYDAQVDFAERLVLENILDAYAHGAQVCTYARVTRLMSQDGKATGIEMISNSEQRSLNCRFIVNAAGPWIDELLQTSSNTDRLIGGTKGSHIVVAPFAGAPPVALYAEAKSDSRPFFIIPWNDNYLIGTTDIHFSGDPDEAQCDDSEVDYLLKESNRVLSGAHLTRDDILFTYSGVRPLPFTNQKDEQRITRRHFIRQHPELENVHSLVGGKLTTYRQLAEECVDLVFDKLNQLRPDCVTAEVTLPGGESLDAFTQPENLTTRVWERLLRVYGSRTKNLLELGERNAALLRPLNDSSLILAGEIVFAFEQDLGRTLTDCLIRRTMCGFNANLAIGEDEQAAAVAQHFLGWTNERTKQEVKEYRCYIQRLRIPDEKAQDGSL
jgi:glycerol-3-phosphate dehydrogenase